jgi:hypothetical protein
MPANIRSSIFCRPVSYQTNIKIKIYRTITEHVVLYGWETWSLTLREVPRLKGLENRVLRTLVGPKSDNVTRELRRPQSGGHPNLHPSPNIIPVIRSRIGWARHVVRMLERRGAHKVLAGEPEGKRTLGRLGRRLEYNIKIDLQKIRWGCELD